MAGRIERLSREGRDWHLQPTQGNSDDLYNKAREVGFKGLCCRFCRGKPGFGRSFSNTIRNLEKTSARDTMVSHISLFCQNCPGDVRDAVQSLKRIVARWVIHYEKSHLRLSSCFVVYGVDFTKSY